MNIEKAKKDLQELEKNLAHWRSNNKGKRIPSELWDEAVRLAMWLGVSKVRKVTQLFYPRLKNRVTEASGARKEIPRKKPQKMSFVEVPLTPLSEREASSEQEFRLLFQLKLRHGTFKVPWI